MNQLEFFVASTECSRAEVRRYLRQLRDLDERIEYHLDCLRYITEQRVQRLATSSADPNDAEGDEGEDDQHLSETEQTPSSGRKRPRRRSTPSRAARKATPALDGRVAHPELLAALAKGTPSSVASGLVEPRVAPYTGLPVHALRAAYVHHRTRALRHAEERRAVAAELAERGGELKGAMAVRLAQFDEGVEEHSTH